MSFDYPSFPEPAGSFGDFSAPALRIDGTILNPAERPVIPAAYKDPTPVGGAGALVDNSDATYVDLDAGWGNLSGTNQTTLTMIQFPAYDGPLDEIWVTVRATPIGSYPWMSATLGLWVYLFSGDAYFPGNEYRYQFPGGSPFSDRASDSLYPGQTVDITARPFFPADFPLATVQGWLAAGTLRANLFAVTAPNSTTHQHGYRTRAFECHLSLVGAEVEPPVERWIRRPLRLHPRSDGLGMSGVRRYGTNSRSVQASLRRGGGTYI